MFPKFVNRFYTNERTHKLRIVRTFDCIWIACFSGFIPPKIVKYDRRLFSHGKPEMTGKQSALRPNDARIMRQRNKHPRTAQMLWALWAKLADFNLIPMGRASDMSRWFYTHRARCVHCSTKIREYVSHRATDTCPHSLWRCFEICARIASGWRRYCQYRVLHLADFNPPFAFNRYQVRLNLYNNTTTMWTLFTLLFLSIITKAKTLWSCFLYE